MLLPAELDYKALTVSPVDAQLIDMLKLNRSMIAGIFNVPAHMINDRKSDFFQYFRTIHSVCPAYGHALGGELGTGA